MEILKIVLIVFEVIASLALILIVLFQSGKEAGLSGALSGNSDSYLSKSGKSLDKQLASATKWVALVWLVLTLALLAASFASAQGSLKLGDVLHYILGIVSVPMFCSSIWALSLFLWACLFIASFPKVIGK